MRAGYKPFDKNVMVMLGAKAKRAFSRFGAYVRTTARRSIRKARHLRPGEMTERQRQNYDAAVRIARQKGDPKPKRPYKSSEPGEPPRWRPSPRYGGKSRLKNLFAYHYSESEKSVVVGPMLANTTARTKGLAALEGGGTVRSKNKVYKIKARPFMRPAMDTAVNNGVLLKGFE